MRCLILGIIMMLLVGCGSSVNDNPNECVYSVQDDFGNIVEFTSKPQRVYATTLSIEELLVELLPPERIAAISTDAVDDNYSLIVDKAQRISKKVPPRINVESVVALRPDLVIVQANVNKAYIDALKDVGLKVFVTKVPTTINMVKSRIIKISEAVGEVEKGKLIIGDMNKKLSSVDSKVGALPKNKRKIAIAYSMLGAFGSKDGLYNDICERSGLLNGAAMAGLVRGEHLSKERIVDINPDVLIFPSYSSTQKGDVERMRQEVLNDPSLQTTNAIVNNNYIIINDRYRYSASQYIADGVLDISRKAYPELYNKR